MNAYRLTVNSKAGVLSMVHLLNGSMRTAKIYSLARLIDWVNQEQGAAKPAANIEKRPINKEPIEATSWLSGFIEADGCFYVRATESTLQRKFARGPKAGPKAGPEAAECSFELVQAQETFLGHSTKECLDEIAKLLQATVKEIGKKGQYRVRTANLESNLRASAYIKEFPLFGKKHLD